MNLDKSSRVGVVILNFKVKDLTIKCLHSVKKSTYKNIQIIVVDNNSGDNVEQEIIKSKDIIFIQSGGNLGYTGGNNIGIKKALELGCDFVFILNPDTTIEKNTISALLNCFDGDAGIVGPKIYFENSKKIWFAGGIFDRDNVLGSHRGVNELDHNQYNDLQETDFVSGAALLIKKEVFDKIGFFDERYFLYYEDSDFCTRAKRTGFKITYCPKSVVYHANARSTGLGSPLQDYFITRNRFIYAFKFLKLRTKLALLGEGLRNLSNKARRQALTDFLTINLGKGSLEKFLNKE